MLWRNPYRAEPYSIKSKGGGMTKEIATTLAGLAPRELVGIVSQWSTMPIKERIAAASKFSFLAWLSKSLDVLPPYSVLELKRFAKDCGVTAEVYLDVDRNCRVSLARETRKYYSIVELMENSSCYF